MTKYYSIFFSACFWVIGLSGFAQFNDDFSDGDFTSNPEWSGDVSLFTIATYPPDPGNQALRSNSPSEADYYLSTPSLLVAETSWEFFFNLQFATSGVNYFDAFLVADNSDLNNVQNGYFLRFGTTNDDITFWKRVAGSDELLIDGPDGQIGSSSNNPFNVLTTLNDVGLWTISVDEGATGNYALFGTITDNDITTTQAFGFRVVQSSAASPVNSHWFDNIEVAEILPDITPPAPLSVEAVSLTELIVQFDEVLDPSSAEEASNYALIPAIGAPQSAILNGVNDSEVTLVFADELVNGNTYTLNISGVADISGNAIVSESIVFTVIIPEIAEYKDVVFNEIMADPNPVVGNLPELEYIEIYNASTKYLQLENWELINSGASTVLPSVLMSPGDYFILCSEENASSFNDFGTAVGLSSFAALTNGGDDLALQNDDGVQIDAVTYSDNWYGDPDKEDGGWSLELINPETPCSDSQNWTASNDPNGGTPGTQNSVYDTTPDSTPPGLIGFSIEGPQLISVYFNEILDPTSLGSVVVSISPDLGINEVLIGEDIASLQVSFNNPIDTAVYYTLAISGITDCIGNPVSTETSIDFVIGFSPGPYDIILNELMADPTPEIGWPDQEYIELYNRTDALFDLSGCTLSGLAFSDNTFIQPQGYLLLVSSDAAAYVEADSVAVLNNMSSTFLTNGGRELVLQNGQGEVVDRVNYSSDWYRDSEKSDGGWSLERINPDEPCRGGDNWRASTHPSGGTPGQVNSVLDFTPDNKAPELLTILYNDSTTIELVFDEVLDSLSVISAGYSFDPDLTIFDIQNVSPDYQRVRLRFADPMVPNQKYQITIFGLSDCSGNEYSNNDEEAFGRPAEPTSGTLILNEVLFNERTGGDDFVEIYNNSNSIISLKNWKLGNLDNEQYNLITTEGETLFPGEYIAITTGKQNVLFEYPLSPARQVLQVDDIPTLNNSDGRVVLIDPSGDTIDRFDYSEDYHFALLNDLDGVSLERIDFNRPTNDATNWTSASEVFNWGTPGFENSQFQPVGETDSDVQVEPEIFSPDNDGYQDVLNINYQFDRSGLAANVTIFDSAGRLVRQLARNELLGTNGTISWDGTTEDGERARVGIHVVYFEVFATDGYTSVYKLSCVVASRL